MAWSSIGLPC
ncbi:hypothetical protein D046_6578A, partial [Vibrio parahaemolyticus V-223/04]